MESCLDQAGSWDDQLCQCLHDPHHHQQQCHQLFSLTTELSIIFVLGTSIILMLIVIMILIRRIYAMKKRIRIQESLRRIQNIDSFYEFMSKKASDNCNGNKTIHQEDKYEHVCRMSQTSEVSSSVSTEHYSPPPSYTGIFTSPTSCEEDAKDNNIDYIETVTKPIDEALLLLKLSADQL